MLLNINFQNFLDLILKINVKKITLAPALPTLVVRSNINTVRSTASINFWKFIFPTLPDASTANMISPATLQTTTGCAVRKTGSLLHFRYTSSDKNNFRVQLGCGRTTQNAIHETFF